MEDGGGGGQGSRWQNLQEPGARLRCAPQDPQGPPETLPHWPIPFLNPGLRHLLPIRPLVQPCPEGLSLGPTPPLTLKASSSRSTMLDESSCSSPSEETGKYVCSFCRRECHAGAKSLTNTILLIPGSSFGVIPTLQRGKLRPRPCWYIPAPALLALPCLGAGLGVGI